MSKSQFIFMLLPLFFHFDAFSGQTVNLENCSQLINEFESYNQTQVCSNKDFLEKCSAVINSEGRATARVILVMAEDVLSRAKCDSKKTEAGVCHDCRALSVDSVSNLKDLAKLAKTLSNPSTQYCKSGISLIKQRSTKKRICSLDKELFVKCAEVLSGTLAVESVMIGDDLERLQEAGTCRQILGKPESCKDCNDNWGSFSPEQIKMREELLELRKQHQQNRGQPKKKPGEYEI